MLIIHQVSYARNKINKQRQSPLFSLPGEIRNKIMEHLLVPGKIYLKNPFAKRNAAASLSDGCSGDCGQAYLASCRLAHQEGHEYYYGRNMFYLPPGEITYTLQFFYVLDPRHAALISSLGVEIGLFDLTLDMFDATIKDFTDSRGNLMDISGRGRAATDIVSTVQYTWLKKLDHIYDCQGYTEVKVQFGNTVALLDGQRLANELKDIIFWCGVSNVDECNKDLSHILREATLALRCYLEHILSGGGIDIAREWITRGCPTRLNEIGLCACH